MARPSKLNYWLNENRTTLEKILGTCNTDKEICKALGVDNSTFYRWREENAMFKELYTAKKKECKDNIAKLKLEDAEQHLLNLIKGTCEEVTTTEELMQAEDGTMKLIVTKRVTKKLAPNVTAIIFALKNLDPSKWKDRPLDDDTKNDLSKLDMLIKGIDLQANGESNN